MWSRLRGAVLCLPILIVTASCASAHVTVSGPPVPATAADRLRVTAANVAAADGAPSYAWIRAVETTRNRALQVATPGDIIPGVANQRVYLVVLKGNFTDTTASRPPGAQAPSGHYLALVFDVSTFQITDVGLSDHVPALDSLGPIRNLN